MRDLHHQLNIVEAIAPAVYAADKVGAVIDRLGYGSLAFALQVGIGGITFTGTNKIAVLIEHEVDGVYAVVPADQIVGITGMGSDGILVTYNSAHAAATVLRFGYIGDARKVRITADFSGAHGTGTPIGAVAILGRGQLQPAA